jgi:hypothetical protein
LKIVSKNPIVKAPPPLKAKIEQRQ